MSLRAPEVMPTTAEELGQHLACKDRQTHTFRFWFFLRSACVGAKTMIQDTFYPDLNLNLTLNLTFKPSLIPQGALRRGEDRPYFG